MKTDKWFYATILLTALFLSVSSTQVVYAEDGDEQAVPAKEDEQNDNDEDDDEDDYAIDPDLPLQNIRALDFTSHIELGFGYVSEDSIIYGGYNGLDDQGAFGIANIDFNYQGAYDDDNARYWNFTTDNLGTDARRIRGEYGKQGHYKTWFSYREMPRVEWLNDGARTPFNMTTAENIIALPTAWGATPYANNLLRPADLTYERQNYEFGLSWNFTENWSFLAEFIREDKDGYKSLGTYAPMMLVEQPLDYQENKLRISLAYHDARVQSELRYEWSDFENEFRNLIIDRDIANAFDDIQMGLPVSNDFQQIAWTGAIRLGQTSRLSAAASYGQREQDERFLPYTIDPAILAIAPPLPRTSLDGNVDVTHFNVKFTTRPIRKLNLMASYTLDERDQDTPMAVYNYVLLDFLANREERINLPYDFKTQKWAVQGSYRPHRTLKTTLGYKHRRHERSPFSEVVRNDEDTFWTKFDWTPSALFGASVKAEYSDRDGTGYDFDSQWIASRLPGGSAVRRNPDTIHFNKADRERIRVIFNASYTPNEFIDIGFSADVAADDYHNSRLGLKDNDTNTYNLDFNYHPIQALNLFAYFSFMDTDNTQANQDRRGGPSRPVWTLETDEEAYMYGAGIDWEAIKNKLDISAGINYLDANTDYSFNPQNTPDLPHASDRFDFNLAAEYHYRTDMSFKLQYDYLHFDADDYAFDGIDITTDVGSGRIYFGNVTPNDSVHTFMLSAVKYF